MENYFVRRVKKFRFSIYKIHPLLTSPLARGRDLHPFLRSLHKYQILHFLCEFYLKALRSNYKIFCIEVFSVPPPLLRGEVRRVWKITSFQPISAANNVLERENQYRFDSSHSEGWRLLSLTYDFH